MPADKHGRDPTISEIVRYFDQPERCAWHLLTDKEAAILHEEIRKCSDPDSGFRYIARNYYWITTKEGIDILLRFKDTQELIWETIRWLRLRGLGVKLLIIKARQLYCSSLCVAYLAYLTQFNPNNRGLLVSYDETHAGKLFRLALHIYDQLPWWLRPMIGTRKYEEGIHLINPDPDLRRINPGLNSSITVQGATQNVGVAEGETVNAAVLSEIGSWDKVKARKIIVSDFRWALPDAENTFAVLETRVRQASKFVERLWEANVELGENASWHPLFIPIYFDKSHFVAPRAGWKPDKPEMAVKERAAEEWVACGSCGQIRPAMFGGANMVGIPCRDCKTSTYQPYVLQDGQMNWLWQQRLFAEKMGEKAVEEMGQSLATNPQEAFSNVTETVFSKQARDWVASTVRPELMRGYMASDGVFHAPRRQHGQESMQCCAPGCKQDHTGEVERYLRIWQPPMRGVKYALGADVAAGHGGSNDYSVIIVNRISHIPEPDIQVAQYRCNTIGAWHFADLINTVGRFYNNALVVVDHTNHQTTGDRLRNFFAYPNLYRWYLADAINQQSNRLHWIWNGKNKADGWSTLDGWLRDRSLIVKDATLAKEIRHFQRLPDGTLGAPDSKDEDGLGDDFEKIHDDCVMTMIQLIVASHQQDPRRSNDMSASQPEGVRAAGSWTGICTKCTKTFPAQAPCERDRCVFCGSCWLRWKLDKPEGLVGVGSNALLGFEWNDMGGTPGTVRDRYGKSDEFSYGPSSMREG